METKVLEERWGKGRGQVIVDAREARVLDTWWGDLSFIQGGPEEGTLGASR